VGLRPTNDGDSEEGGSAIASKHANLSTTTNRRPIQGIVGESEDLHLEVKECRAPLAANMKGYVSQAISGFANSDEESAVEALGALERSIGTRRSMIRQFQFGQELDIHSALPLVDVPTLVMHAKLLWPEALARYTTEHIRGARYVAVPGFGSWDLRKQDVFCDVIQEFLTPASNS
jgi:pimeloyl-ACP methyl ester carboxylesterase